MTPLNREDPTTGYPRFFSGGKRSNQGCRKCQ